MERQHVRPQEESHGMVGTPVQVCWARRLRGALAGQRAQVEEACADLAAARPGEEPQNLARWYLSHALHHQRRAEWWIANRDYLCEAWFIQEYLRDYLFQEDVPPDVRAPQGLREESLLCPAEVRFRGAVEVVVEPSGAGDGAGLLCMRYVANPALSHLSRQMHMAWDGNRRAYVRQVDVCAGPLTDRGAELCARLLTAGFRVLCTSGAVRDKALSGEYALEHPRWIRMGANGRSLEICYPSDPLLNRRARSLGARWNGHAMELGLWFADELEDFARLYGFHIAPDAGERMERWRALVRDAQLWQPNGKPALETAIPEGDPLEAMLVAPRPVPEDLRDDGV